MKRSRHRLAAALALAAIALAAGSVQAQQNKGPANPLQGFSTNRGEPVRIKANTLEVRDKDKAATFSGDVHVVQGDTEMRCQTLVVFYEGGSIKDAGKAKDAKGKDSGKSKDSGPGRTVDPADPSQGQIRRMEAKGGVTVSQKDQVATGETGIYDMKANTVTLLGNVVVTKGEDVLKGQRLVVDLTNGVSRVESASAGRTSKGQVEVLIGPKSQRQETKQDSKQESRQESRQGQNTKQGQAPRSLLPN